MGITQKVDTILHQLDNFESRVNQVVNLAGKAGDLLNVENAVERLVEEAVHDTADLVQQTQVKLVQKLDRAIQPKMAGKKNNNKVRDTVNVAKVKQRRIDNQARKQAERTRARAKPVGPQLVAAPLAMTMFPQKSRYSTKSNGDSMTVVCHDRISTLPGNLNAHEEGYVFFKQNLNPSRFISTPLEVESLLWDKFRIKRVKFSYVPSTGASTSGSLVGAVDTDAKDENGYPVGEAINVRQFCAHNVAKEVTFWAPAEWEFVNQDPQTLYIRSQDPENYWTTPGIFAMCLGVPPSASAQFGAVYFEAEFEFYDRNVEGAIQEFGAWLSTATAATSSAPFNTAVLTTKAPSINTVEPPTIGTSLTANDELDFTDLAPERTYLFYLRYTSGTTCSANPTVTTPSGVTVGTARNYYDSVSSCSLVTVTANSKGIIKLACTSGTWVASPQKCDIIVTSVPSESIAIL